MKVSISDMRMVSEKLLAHLEQNGHDSVDVPFDYYWSIPKDGRYDPLHEPEEFTIGQLEDDWSELQKIIQGEKEPIGYALIWLAAILQCIGHEVVS